MTVQSLIIRTIALVAVMAIACAVASADRATLRVRVNEPTVKVSPKLYGIFFEEINHAGDGGLYAELIRNRAFEDAATPEGWSLVTDGGSAGKMAPDDTQPLNEMTPHSLRLDITSAGTGRVGVANSGYWGIAVKKGVAYLLSLYARASAGFRGPLTVSLESASGQVYATGRIEGLTPEWKRFRAALTANATYPAARLVIAGDKEGTVWLDVVSMFPRDTWKRRPNGLRPDLAQKLDDLKPAFVRFPGGCFCEGNRLENAFRWKKSIGDIAERPGHWNLWGYRSADGLGYHEYLQMCEDLGAEPLFVINCGMAHENIVPLDQLDEWVQDALDAIEYANGPVTSKWGALRAKNGHPAPFHLKYIEVGNENGGPAYEERYARFYDAIKAKYPEMQLVANVPVKSRPMDILDEHYYSSPEWFSANARRYDSYRREGPKIYVGEYAVTQNCGQGNLRAALGEAAFMTGMERNADKVVMCSYAPLFVNVHNRAWNPDAICFDSARSYGTPSYYVQKLFSLNRPDVILPVEMETATQSAPAPRGAIGLGTWATQAEYKDVTVTRSGQALYAADFSSGAPGWRIVRGDWQAQDGAFRQSSRETDLRAVAGDPKWTDYTLSLKARKIGGAEGFLIMFRVRDDNNWYWWNIGGWNNTRHAIEKSSGGGKTILGSEVPDSVEMGRWYDIRVELQGRRIRCYLDGRLIHDVEDRGPEPVAAVAGLAEKTGEVILKVVNTSESAQDTEVTLEGAGEVEPQATLLLLTANSPDDENSLADPAKVIPVMQKASVGPSFRHTFPPHSLTILRIKTKGD
jgi:alpha-L-arabinofuranosidase